jgi:pimeloyl-ACP methyl ester carboxylesterase
MNFDRASAFVIDGAMCASMYAIQRRHRLDATSRAALADYIATHEPLTRDAYFQAPALDHSALDARPPALRWASPIKTAFPANDRIHVDLFPCPAGWSEPTVIFLHALMSASDRGYRRWAADFNARGWNACFVHLPYHYSRTPRGHWNGELAITADLVRTAEGLRQGVVELRQLMDTLRAWGCRELGLWASSYGGWIGALLASVESDFRFVALLEPIVDVEHAIWTSPAGASLRREFRRIGIEQPLIERHFRLASPLHGEPLCGANRVLLCAGEYDRVTRVSEIARLHERWPGSELLRVPQGHFGFRMMRTAWTHLTQRGVL